MSGFVHYTDSRSSTHVARVAPASVVFSVDDGLGSLAIRCLTDSEAFPRQRAEVPAQRQCRHLLRGKTDWRALRGRMPEFRTELRLRDRHLHAKEVTPPWTTRSASGRSPAETPG